MNGPLKFLTQLAKYYLSLLDLLAKFKRVLASHCRLLALPNSFAVARMLAFLSVQKGSQRQTYTDSQCGFCGCVTLSNAFELHFCSYKHVFQRFTSFVGYDRRSFKNCFQQRLIFYKTPVCHQRLFKILYRWVISCNERQQSLFIFLLSFQL